MEELIFNINVIYLAQRCNKNMIVHNVSTLDNYIFIGEAETHFGTQSQS